MKVSGGEYAKVSARLKMFREDCPNGLIETTPTFTDDGLMFSARILKDKSRPESGEATGHALGKNTGAKAFEKLESISVGRALAMLGYLAGGEIASSEEMEEFYSYRDQKIEEAIDRLNDAKTLDELRSVFMGLDALIAEKSVIDAKDKRKKELSQIQQLKPMLKETQDENTTATATK
jgi:hypothetical protein